MATNEHPPSPETPVPTGKRYTSVEDMLRGEGSYQDFTQRFSELSDATRVTRILAQLRAAHGLTQKQMGEQMGLTQGAISKLEAGRDEELKLSEVCAYARILNERIGVLYGPPPNHVEAITAYLNRVKFHMLELAKVAQNDAEMDNRMNRFFSETYMKVMEMLALVYTNLPKGIEGCEFTKEVIHRNSTAATEVVSITMPAARSKELVHA